MRAVLVVGGGAIILKSQHVMVMGLQFKQIRGIILWSQW